MLSITFPLFIKPDIYVVQITSRCPGKCSSSYLYFMEFDQKSKKVTVRHKYEASYSQGSIVNGSVFSSGGCEEECKEQHIYVKL